MHLVIDDVTVIEESLNTCNTAWDIINNNRHLKPKVGCKASPDCFKTFEEIVNVMPLVTQDPLDLTLVTYHNTESVEWGTPIRSCQDEDSKKLPRHQVVLTYLCFSSYV